MTDNQSRKYDILFKFLRQGDKDAEGAFERLQKRLAGNKETLEELNAEFLVTQRRARASELGEEYGRLAANIEDSEIASKRLAESLTKIGATKSEIREAAREFERFRTAQLEGDGGGSGGSAGRFNVGTVGRGLSGLGFSEAGQLANTADDLKDIYEQFKSISGVSTAVGAGTTAAAGGFTATLTAIAPIAAVAIAGALAVKALTDAIAAQKKMVDDVVTQLKEDTDARLNDIEVIKSGTSEQIKSTLEVQQAKLEQVQLEKAQREAFLADIRQQYTDLGGAIDPARRAALGAAGQVAEQSIADLAAREEELTAAIKNNTENILPAIELREQEAEAIRLQTEATNIRLAAITAQVANETKIANQIATLTREQAEARLAAIEIEKQSKIDELTQLSALAEKTPEVTARINQLGSEFTLLSDESTALSSNLNRLPAELKNTGEEFIKAATDLAKANQEYAKTVEARIEYDRRAAETGELERQIADAKARESTQASLDKIQELRDSAAEAEAESVAKGIAKQAEINAKFMDSELKALDSYIKAEKQATENYSTQRIRKLEDLYSSLLDLSSKGDVAAFIQTRRTGLRDVRRGDEDFGSDAQQRKQDYEDARRDAKAARDQQLADLKISLDTERAQRAAQLAERIAQEQAAGNAQIKESEKLQQQLARLRDSYAAQDLAAKRQAEDQAYQLQVTRLQQRQQEISKIIVKSLDPLVQPINTIATAIVNLINRAREAASKPVVTGSPSEVQVGNNFITAYDGGTDSVPRDGVYHLRKDEAVLTVNQNRARRRGDSISSGGGRQVVVNVNATFGEIVTPSQMREQIGELVAGVNLAVNGGSTS